MMRGLTHFFLAAAIVIVTGLGISRLSAGPPIGSAVVIAPTNIAMWGLAPVNSTAAEGSHVLCTGPCNLYNVTVTIGATSGWLLLFDATAAPADGAVTPIWWFPVASNATNGGATANWGPGPPLGTTTGLTAVFSTTGPFTKTVSATAAFSAGVQQQ